jgi:ATP adenylyltransferase
MKHLWSPWRMAYIQEHNKGTDCAFCRESARPDSAENLIVYRGRLAFVILNRFPYTSGHLMIVSYQHESQLENLHIEQRTEMMELVAQSVEVLKKVYSPQGFNVGINLGEAAGAGIREHVHIHVVPRWGGDTNFMTALAETRVLPERLEDTYQRVQSAWQTTFGLGHGNQER